MIAAFLAAGFQNDAFQVAAEPTKKGAGGYGKKRNYIINGRRLSLSQNELDAELHRVISESKTASKPTPVVVASEAKENDTPIKTETIAGVQFQFMLDGIERQRILDAINRIELEKLGPWLKQHAEQKAEEDMMLLLLLG